MRSRSSSKPPTFGACPGWRRSTYGTAPTSGPRDCARAGGHGRARRSSAPYGRGPTSVAAPRITISGRRLAASIRPPARSPTCSAAGRPRCAPPTSLPRCTRPGARPRSSTGSRPSRAHTDGLPPAATCAIPAARPTRPPARSSALRLAARRARQAWLARSLDARRRRRDSRRVACLRARARSTTHVRGVAKRAPQTGRIIDHPPARQLELCPRRIPRPRRSHSSERPPRTPMRQTVGERLEWIPARPTRGASYPGLRVAAVARRNSRSAAARTVCRSR
jgi:hypothetical protein